jgi:hypothetical protein
MAPPAPAFNVQSERECAIKAHSLSLCSSMQQRKKWSGQGIVCSTRLNEIASETTTAGTPNGTPAVFAYQEATLNQ